MFSLRRLASLRLCSDATALRLAQWFCFAAAPALLYLAVLAVARHAGTAGEIVIGVLGSGTLALSTVALGLALPRSQTLEP